MNTGKAPERGSGPDKGPATADTWEGGTSARCESGKFQGGRVGKQPPASAPLSIQPPSCIQSQTSPRKQAERATICSSTSLGSNLGFTTDKLCDLQHVVHLSQPQAPSQTWGEVFTRSGETVSETTFKSIRELLVTPPVWQGVQFSPLDPRPS